MALTRDDMETAIVAADCLILGVHTINLCLSSYSRLVDFEEEEDDPVDRVLSAVTDLLASQRKHLRSRPIIVRQISPHPGEQLLGYLETHTRLFERLVGMNASQFTVLYSRVSEEMQPPFSHNKHPLLVPVSEAKKIARTHPTHVRGEVVLLLGLLHLRGATCVQLAGAIGLSVTHAHMLSNVAVVRLFHVLSPDLIRWPTAEQRIVLSTMAGSLIGCMGAIDGTFLRVGDTAASQIFGKRGYGQFSGKHHVPARNFQLVCDVHGRVLYCSKTYPGAANDITGWSHTDMCQHPEKYFSEGQFLIADGGYSNHPNLLMPLNSAALSVSDRLLDTAIRRFRVIVEYVFGDMKLKYRILTRPEMLPSWRGTLPGTNVSMLDCIVGLCAALHNFLLDTGDRPTHARHRANLVDNAGVPLQLHNMPVLLAEAMRHSQRGHHHYYDHRESYYDHDQPLEADLHVEAAPLSE